MTNQTTSTSKSLHFRVNQFALFSGEGYECPSVPYFAIYSQLSKQYRGDIRPEFPHSRRKYPPTVKFGAKRVKMVGLGCCSPHFEISGGSASNRPRDQDSNHPQQDASSTCMVIGRCPQHKVSKTYQRRTTVEFGGCWGLLGGARSRRSVRRTRGV